MMTTPPLNVKVEKIIPGGDALGVDADNTADRKMVFVPYALPGETVSGTPYGKPRPNARVIVQSVTVASADRVEPACPHFFKPGRSIHAVCGGCSWQQAAYPAQLRFKSDLLVDSFRRIGKIHHPPVAPCEGMPEPPGPWRYRNKVQIPFGGSASHVTAGFYAPESHTLVPFGDCLIQSKTAVAVCHALTRWARDNRIVPYQEDKDQGWLRHALLRQNRGGDILLTLVSREKHFPKSRDLIQRLEKDGLPVRGLYQNVNTRRGNAILGPYWKWQGGDKYLKEDIAGLSFLLHPASFTQVNLPMAEEMYKKVLSLVTLKEGESVLELYSGIGVMGQLLAGRAKEVVCVEENAFSVMDGQKAAEHNRRTNVMFLKGRCEMFLRHNTQKLKNRYAWVILDPPRAGCAEEVLKGVMRLNPGHILYVSCDPATLARDARYLSTGGYHLKNCFPFDMFPQTHHVESVNVFEKVSST